MARDELNIQGSQAGKATEVNILPRPAVDCRVADRPDKLISSGTLGLGWQGPLTCGTESTRATVAASTMPITTPVMINLLEFIFFGLTCAAQG